MNFSLKLVDWAIELVLLSHSYRIPVLHGAFTLAVILFGAWTTRRFFKSSKKWDTCKNFMESILTDNELEMGYAERKTISEMQRKTDKQFEKSKKYIFAMWMLYIFSVLFNFIIVWRVS